MYRGDEYFNLSTEKVTNVLSRLERFNAHTRRPISVGQHLLHCLELAEQAGYSFREKQLVVYHDVPEAYYGDIPSYIKKFLGEEANLFLHNIDVQIYEHFGIEWPKKSEHDRVKEIDLIALALEAEYGFGTAFTVDDWPNIPATVDRLLIDDITLLSQKEVASLLDLELNRYKGN